MHYWQVIIDFITFKMTKLIELLAGVIIIVLGCYAPVSIRKISAVTEESGKQTAKLQQQFSLNYLLMMRMMMVISLPPHLLVTLRRKRQRKKNQPRSYFVLPKMMS